MKKIKIATPDWVKSAVFYQIFPDRFARRSCQDNFLADDRFEPWESPPTSHGYKGGNLWGVIDRLDYLEDLGINAIYFNPIFQSASNHRYHTHDYFQVDPILGGNAALEALIEEAHRRHIRIVLDGVFNHASRGFFFFNDILENGAKSPWLDWFHIKEFPLSPYEGEKPANYGCWENLPALPQFNHDNPAVREYIYTIAEYWIKKGLDGWRLDVPNCIKIEGFWQEFRRRVKAINRDAYIVGEIWEDASHWLDGTQFDGVTNYPLTWPIIAYVGGENVNLEVLSHHMRPYQPIDATTFAGRIDAQLKKYPWEIQLTQLNLLDSHDMARFLSIINNDDDAFKLASTLMFTLPGAPCVYYGDEIGMTGASDPDCRRAFRWQKQTWNNEIYNHFRRLIRLRRDHVALSTGSFKILYADRKVITLCREHPSESLLIAVNAGSTEEEFTIDIAHFSDAHRDPRFSPLLTCNQAEFSLLDKVRAKITLTKQSAIVVGLMGGRGD